jgi:hypothetical protein
VNQFGISHAPRFCRTRGKSGSCGRVSPRRGVRVSKRLGLRVPFTWSRLSETRPRGSRPIPRLQILYICALLSRSQLGREGRKHTIGCMVNQASTRNGGRGSCPTRCFRGRQTPAPVPLSPRRLTTCCGTVSRPCRSRPRCGMVSRPYHSRDRRSPAWRLTPGRVAVEGCGSVVRPATKSTGDSGPSAESESHRVESGGSCAFLGSTIVRNALGSRRAASPGQTSSGIRRLLSRLPWGRHGLAPQCG